MASTVSWDGLRDLAGFTAGKGCAISVYVSLDPSTTPTSADVTSRVRSLLDAGAKSREATRPELSHDQRQALRADFERIRAYFEDDFVRNGARGYAVFASGLDDFWTSLSLVEPVPDAIRVGRALYVAPLVPLVGRGEGAIVCAVSRERGQLYRLHEGRLEEVADLSEEQPRRHDQGGLSQSNFQRHSDKLANEHVRTVAEALERRVRQWHAQVVVVASDETRAELEPVLAPDVRAEVIGWVHAESHAGAPELLDVAKPVLERSRVDRERVSVERWQEEVSRGGRAVSGWSKTLEAASDGRVELLLFADGVEHAARECPACGRVEVDRATCPLDGTAMEEVDAGLDLAVHQTLTRGGTVWAVQHQHELEPVEGIGALLRY